MVITQHLSNEQLLDLRLASDEQALRPTLAALAEWGRQAAAQPDAFWWRQQNQIRRRIADSERRSGRVFLRLAWATGLGLIITASLLLHNSPAPAPPQAQADPDHQLLLEVEHVMQSDGPDSLAPAALLAQEISQGAPSTPANTNNKETNHEN